MMKLTWKDMVTTLLVMTCGAIVYAKFYSYSWAGIQSWRSAVAALAVVGLLMFAFSSFNFSNRSILNTGEMVFGIVAFGLAVFGMIMTSSFAFYSLASVLGALWLVDTARHARHSMLSEETIFHHHAPVH